MESIKEYWKFYLFEGILFTLLGGLAIAIPGFVTLSLEILIGSLVLIGGFVQGFRAFQAKSAPDFLISLLISILLIAIGALLLGFPLKGMLAITTVIALFMGVDGIAKMILAFQMKQFQGWTWYLISGIIELLIALLIWNQWPVSGVWFIGTLFGVNLIFFGVSQIIIALEAKSL